MSNVAPTAPLAIARRTMAGRRRRVTFGLVLMLLLLFAAALLLGDYPLSAGEVLAALLSPLTGASVPGAGFIVLELRLPRAVTGLFAGTALGLSGVVFQSVLRNPLASPDIVGITSGASAAAVAAILVLQWNGLPVALAACAGALLTGGLIYSLSWRDGVTPYRLVLVGIGMAAMAGAVISYLFTRARVIEVQQALAWLTGSLNGASFERLWPLAAALLLLVPLLSLLHRALGALQLGDDTAQGLGTRVERTRRGTLAVATLLAAFATATVGPVAFVAFAAGPIARRLLRGAGQGLVAAGLTGAAIVIGADLVAQHALGRNQLPVGVVTGALGALFLIYLLADANRKGRTG